MRHNGLSKAISNLPEHNLTDDLWPVIVSRMEEKQKLQSAIDDLPVHELQNDIWIGVERRLVARKNTRYVQNYLIQIAAGLLLLIGLGWFVSQVVQQHVGGKIVYSEEMISFPVDNSQQFNPTISEIDNNIERFCQVRPHKCNSPAFRELSAQLQQVSETRLELLQMIEESGNQQLIKYSKKLHNQEVRIKKQMVDLVINE